MLIVSAGNAQKLTKPKQMPTTTSPEHLQLIRQGTALHDEKKFDDAIAKYQEVLKANPDSTLAIYEMALSYYTKGDKARAREAAYRGASYFSDELPLFYGIIANILDDEGKPEEAIKIYRTAEDILKGYPESRSQLASIYYNLGVTYVRQKKYVDSRRELKRAVETNFGYASPHYLLSVVFNGTKYKVPAFLSAARLLSLEYNTQRTEISAKLIKDILSPPAKNPKTGNLNIFLDLNAPTDEGDFGMFDLLIGTMTVRGDDDKDKSDNQMFIEAIDAFIGLLAGEKKLASTFVGRNYVPFITELKARGHTEAFGNMVIYINDRNNAEAAKWLEANGIKLQAFFNWARAYTGRS
jgi:tetratricopeptide (TPR) repeat protein